MTLYAAVDGNRLNIIDTADGSMKTIGAVVVTGPLGVVTPVVDYGRPGAFTTSQRPAPQLWDAVIAELGYRAVGEWFSYNRTADGVVWQSEIEPADGVAFTIAGDPPVLTITGVATLDGVLELVVSRRVRYDTRNPHVATVTP